MDANFKLKGKERGFADPPLANGLGYMVSNDLLQAHLAECVAKNLTSEVFARFRILHCSYITHSRSTPVGRRSTRSIRRIRNILKDTLRPGWALWTAHDTGSNAQMVLSTSRKENGKHVQCSRCTVDSFYSTRYANMDLPLLLVLLSAIAQGTTRVLVSYDIACQWIKNLQARISQYSVSAALILSTLIYWKVVVPKFHLIGHGLSCQLGYNINYTKGAGRMCGEGIESGWSQSGSMPIWIRENGPNARRAILDGHWGECNRQKLLGLRMSLARLDSHTLILFKVLFC